MANSETAKIAGISLAVGVVFGWILRGFVNEVRRSFSNKTNNLSFPLESKGMAGSFKREVFLNLFQNKLFQPSL